MKLVLPLRPNLDSLVAASLLCRYINKGFVTQKDIQFAQNPKLCAEVIPDSLPLLPGEHDLTCTFTTLYYVISIRTDHSWKEYERAALRKCDLANASPVIDYLSFFLDALWFEYESTGAFSPTDLAYQVWCAFYQHFNSVVLPYLIHLEKSK